MNDLIAEPWRKALIPGFDEARKALMSLGALAFGISGSGPTVFAIADNSQVAARGKVWLQENFLQTDQGFVRHCRADLAGARQLHGA